MHGHIIDSLILPKVLDVITSRGGSFRIKQIAIGQERGDPSYALVEVQAPSEERLEEILQQIADHGAVPTAAQDCRLVAADIAGAFPEGFYSTTNQRTEIRLEGHWIEVADQEMDCGIVVDRGRRAARCVADDRRAARATWSSSGHAGVRVFPHERDTQRQMFEFMGSQRLDREAQGRGHPRDRRASCSAPPRRRARRWWSAGRPSCTPAAASTCAS